MFLLTWIIWNVSKLLAAAAENTNIVHFEIYSVVYSLIFICDFKSFKINVEIILQ